MIGLINIKQLLCWAFVPKRTWGNLSSWFPESPLFFGSVHEEPRRSGGWRARITFPITHNNAKNSKVQPATPKVLLAGFVNLAERGSISSHVEWKSPWRATGFPSRRRQTPAGAESCVVSFSTAHRALISDGCVSVWQANPDRDTRSHSRAAEMSSWGRRLGCEAAATLRSCIKAGAKRLPLVVFIETSAVRVSQQQVPLEKHLKTE